MLDVFGTAAPQVKAGKVNAFAVVSQQRVKNLPDTPTVFELGVKEFPVPGCYSLVAPTGPLVMVLNKFNAETQKFLADP